MNQLSPISSANRSNQDVALTKGEVFRILNQSIPLNNFHLPDHIYRADLIPETILNEPPGDRALLLDGAALQIGFDHGYPAINETTPLWDQLTGEPEDAFGVFLAYLELPEKSNSDNPIRLLPLISTLTSLPLKQITDWCHMFYWHWRARAYDLFLIASHRKQREQRAMTIEGAHFRESEKLLNKVLLLANKKIDQEIVDITGDPEAMSDTKIKDLVDMATKLVQVQRISVGLPANGVISGSIQLDGPRHTTVEETFKHIAKEGSSEQVSTQRPAEMDALLAAPDDLTRVQEMLTRIARPNHVMPAWGNNKVVDITGSNGSAEEQEADGSGTGVEDLGNPDA